MDTPCSIALGERRCPSLEFFLVLIRTLFRDRSSLALESLALRRQKPFSIAERDSQDFALQDVRPAGTAGATPFVYAQHSLA